jgi:hypothetical protein
MSGSESNSGRDDKESPSEANPTSLADFLATPRARTSVPAPARAAELDEAATPLKATEGPAPDEHTADTPTAPTTASDAPPPRADVGSRAESARASLAPASSGEAKSLIPVASSSSDAPVEEDDTFALPGTSSPWSTASVRRATFVALLAAAAAVPAWVVYRARSVTAPPDRAEAPVAAPRIAAAVNPSTLGTPREIEADNDEPAPAASAAAPVVIDPVKGAELKREARRLLENGVIDQGVATARRSIEMNPNDPECYVLLAAGLQDQGRWAESREVFSRCVHKSNNGINAECVYFATSGTLTNR